MASYGRVWVVLPFVDVKPKILTHAVLPDSRIAIPAAVNPNYRTSTDPTKLFLSVEVVVLTSNEYSVRMYQGSEFWALKRKKLNSQRPRRARDFARASEVFGSSEDRFPSRSEGKEKNGECKGIHWVDMEFQLSDRFHWEGLAYPYPLLIRDYLCASLQLLAPYLDMADS